MHRHERTNRRVYQVFKLFRQVGRYAKCCHGFVSFVLFVSS